MNQMALINDLKKQLEEIKEKYNAMLSGSQSQSMKPNEIEKKKMLLNSMVEKAQRSKSLLMSNLEVSQRIEEVTTQKKQQKQLYQVLLLRKKILLDNWKSDEFKYLLEMDKYEQKYNQMCAKYQEISRRISILSKYKNSQSRDLSGLAQNFFSGFNSEMRIDNRFIENSFEEEEEEEFEDDYEDTRTCPISIVNQRKLEELQKKCRDLLEERNRLTALKSNPT